MEKRVYFLLFRKLKKTCNICLAKKKKQWEENKLKERETYHLENREQYKENHDENALKDITTFLSSLSTNNTNSSSFSYPYKQIPTLVINNNYNGYECNNLCTVKSEVWTAVDPQNMNRKVFRKSPQSSLIAPDSIFKSFDNPNVQ